MLEATARLIAQVEAATTLNALHEAAMAVDDHSATATHAWLRDDRDEGAQRLHGEASGPLRATLDWATRQAQDDPTADPLARTWLAAQFHPKPLHPAAEEAWLAAKTHGLMAWTDRWHHLTRDANHSQPTGAPRTLAERAERFASEQLRMEAVLRPMAEVATHIYGHRLDEATLRCETPLAQSLRQSAMSRATLDAMLDTCRAARPLLHRYLRARATLLGVSDSDVLPVGIRHQPLARSTPLTQNEAIDRVKRAFRNVPRLAAFADRALTDGWVQMSSSPHTRDMATCSHQPSHMQSIITFASSGTASDVITLGHELGHAYHAEVLWRTGATPIQLPISVAESASLVAEGLVRPFAGGTTHLSVLDAHLAGATKWLIDAPQTLELELAMYDLAGKGPLEVDALKSAAMESYERWFGPIGGASGAYWAQQFLLYVPDRPCLALPYIAAYLFAARVHEGSTTDGFQDRWDAVLSQTPHSTVEQLGLSHLGVDFTRSTAYEPILKNLRDDVAAFEELARGR